MKKANALTAVLLVLPVVIAACQSRKAPLASPTAASPMGDGTASASFATPSSSPIGPGPGPSPVGPGPAPTPIGPHPGGPTPTPTPTPDPTATPVPSATPTPGATPRPTPPIPPNPNCRSGEVVLSATNLPQNAGPLGSSVRIAIPSNISGCFFELLEVGLSFQPTSDPTFDHILRTNALIEQRGTASTNGVWASIRLWDTFAGTLLSGTSAGGTNCELIFDRTSSIGFSDAGVPPYVGRYLITDTFQQNNTLTDFFYPGDTLLFRTRLVNGRGQAMNATCFSVKLNVFASN
jgi:hypothetical protein